APAGELVVARLAVDAVQAAAALDDVVARRADHDRDPRLDRHRRRPRPRAEALDRQATGRQAAEDRPGAAELVADVDARAILRPGREARAAAGAHARERPLAADVEDHRDVLAAIGPDDGATAGRRERQPAAADPGSDPVARAELALRPEAHEAAAARGGRRDPDVALARRERDRPRRGDLDALDQREALEAQRPHPGGRADT